MVRPSDYATNNSIVVAAIETFAHCKKFTMQRVQYDRDIKQWNEKKKDG